MLGLKSLPSCCLWRDSCGSRTLYCPSSSQHKLVCPLLPFSLGVPSFHSVSEDLASLSHEPRAGHWGNSVDFPLPFLHCVLSSRFLWRFYFSCQMPLGLQGHLFLLLLFPVLLPPLLSFPSSFSFSLFLLLLLPLLLQIIFQCPMSDGAYHSTIFPKVPRSLFKKNKTQQVSR